MNNLFLTVVSLSIICSFIILCVILLNKILWRNYSSQWKYIIWAVIALRLIIPVNISVIDIPGILNVDSTFGNFIQSADTTGNSNSLKPSDNLLEENEQITADVIDIADNTNPSEVVTQQEISDDESVTIQTFLPFSILDILTVIWIVGAFLFLSYHLLALYHYKTKLSRWSISIKNNEILEQFDCLCSELNINRKINLVTCNQVFSPILVGIIKPSIVLPSQDFTMEQYNFILRHELIHYKQHDLFYKIILLCANAVHWFNPLIHYMVSLANSDIELHCDEKLVAENNLIYRENYSNMLLHIMTGAKKNNNILLSTGFSSKNKQLKNRFFHIMNSKPTKKGTCLIISLICLIIVGGNIIAWFVPAKIGNAETTDTQISPLNSATVSNLTQDTSENTIKYTTDQLEETSNILVVGIDGTNSEDYSRADSILVVGVNPITKKIYLTSFLRDIYLKIPDHGMDKLSSVYILGGSELIKNTIETNFGLTIDHTVTVNMGAFENIINSIGGIEIELSEQEAEYLNKTNFISDKNYRNVVAGKQILNGNQVLGYIRVRNIPTLQGTTGDLGRTARLRSLLSCVIKEYSKEDINELIKLLISIIPNVSTDLKLDQIIIYLNTVLQEGVNTDTFSIPVEGSYTQKVQEGMSILDLDLEENIKVLKQMYH